MINLTPLLKACPVRPISQAGDQYAADLVRGLEEELTTAKSAADFLEATHLTKANADFLRMAIDRVALGRDSTSPSVYQLYSRYGGGKTHSLLLLAAAAMYPDLPCWRETAALHPTAANVIAFDGEKHDVVSGAVLDAHGNRAKSLAGYLLYHLGGPAALTDFAAGDETLADPGADAFRRLIGENPVIIVIDELVHYISRVNQRAAADPRASTEGVLTTLSALANAVSNSPKAVLVITTPEDAHELLEAGNAARAGDALQVDAIALTSMLERINSQLSRVMYPTAPAEEADLPAILRKRLFRNVDENARVAAAEAYAAVAARNGRDSGELDYQGFHNAYPFHPSLLKIITSRLAANRNFQRVRGTLRLMGNTLLEMQRTGDRSALIHPYHATPRTARIRDEVVNRPGFSELDPAIDTDIVGQNSTTAKTGNELAERAAVTMLLGTIAPDSTNGLYADEIADAILSPEHGDFGVIANAVNQFLSRAIYVDDSPDTQRKRFSKDANVMKELLEAKDAVLSDTTKMSELLWHAINSVYDDGGNRKGDRFELRLFPSRQSNLPDNPDQVTLGIVNPDFWNWIEADNPVNDMSRADLLDLHRHSSNNDGKATRQYPNNALLLAAHDGNFSRIRDEIATMEAAERLLNDKSKALPQHRRETLESTRADAEKNATAGIQNKFTHLFSAGNSPQHQWPEANSHFEVRTLDSLTDAIGKGQEAILEELGDQVLHGSQNRLNKTVWARIVIIANEQGSTLGELRGYFARTPDMRIVINDATWRAMISNAIKDEALHVKTASGEENPTGYDPNWQVWAKGHEPAPPVVPKPPPVPPPNPRPAPPTKPTEFRSGQQPGKVAYAAVKQFMDDHGHDWSALQSCMVQGTAPALANQVASIAQGQDDGIAITMKAGNQRMQVSILNSPPSEFKEYARFATSMMTKAGITDADVTVQLQPEAAPRVLEKLNNRDEASIAVSFRPEGNP